VFSAAWRDGHVRNRKVDVINNNYSPGVDRVDGVTGRWVYMVDASRRARVRRSLRRTGQLTGDSDSDGE